MDQYNRVLKRPIKKLSFNKRFPKRIRQFRDAKYSDLLVSIRMMRWITQR